ncbi:hypothetical protein MKX01_029164 [Papaver californicum]|nr:hypothetical protein MKX01_029164 [Papaver californicum]
MIELSDSESSSDEECKVQVKSEVDEFGVGSSSVAMTSRRPATQNVKSEPAGSSDRISSPLTDDSDFSLDGAEMEELEVKSEVIEDTRAYLLTMNFSVKEVDSAIERLGEHAPVNELVDYIVPTQIAEGAAKNEEATTASLFATMDRTLRLLEMGFTEEEISFAIEKYGGDISVQELADSIFAKQNGDTWVVKQRKVSDAELLKHLCHKIMLQVQVSIHTKNTPTLKKVSKGKDQKLKSIEPISVSESFDDYKVPFSSHSTGPSRRLLGSIAKPPYFFYGNVLSVSNNTWVRITQFLYGVAQEFEGYVHNLPTENRYHILPKTAITIEGMMAHTKPWWPSWDTRKHLSCINLEATGIYQLCERLGRILADTRGVPSKMQQSEIIHHCKTLNLVWTGKNKLSPIEPEYTEQILGYPANHTDVVRYDSTERLRLLKYSFQTETLGYHLSALKKIYPNGLNMLSIYSGIGGAEVALHRLGVHLKCVVSVEDSETNRRILKRWWDSTRQTGKLVQIEDIGKMTSSRIECLTKEYGGFDFVVCQNPCALMSASPNGAVDADLDTNMFFEFVRVLQRVRGSVGSNR